MMCPSEEEWLRVELGDVTVNVAKAIEEHVVSCAACRARRDEHRQLIEDLSPSSDPNSDEAFVRKVMDACEKASSDIPPAARPRAWAPWTALVLAAGIALYFGTAPSADDRRETWTARGSHSSQSQAPKQSGLRVEVFVVRGNESLPVEGSTLQRGDGFAVRYWKTAALSEYLLAFAIDAAGDVHWIYPAYLDPGSDPGAVPLVLAEGRLLDEVSEPDSPAPGPMRVVAIAADESVTIKTIERRLGKGSREAVIANIRNVVPNARVSEWNCEWK